MLLRTRLLLLRLEWTRAYQFVSIIALNLAVRAEGDYEVTYSDGDEDVTIYFNICEYTINKCSDDASDYANQINSNNTCEHLSSDSINEQTVALLDSEFPDKGVALSYTGGNWCNDTNQYTLTIEINCDEDAGFTEYELSSSETLEDTCSPVIVMYTTEGCPVFSIHALYSFCSKYRDWIGVIFMGIGGFLLGAGGRFYKASMFLAGEASVILIVMLSIYVFLLPIDTPEWTVWICLAVSAGIGAGVGYAGARWPRLGVLIISSMLGLLIGHLLYNVIVSTFVDTGNILTIWATMAISALVIGLISIALFDLAVIFGTAIVGSYLLVRGFACIFGGYPNEFIVYSEFADDKMSEVSKSFYMYMVVIMLLSVVSIIVQMSNREGNKDLYNYRRYDFKYRRV